ncbi:MAG TPA: hypothetical protein VK524_16195 [Polyangiaceae bacterium]|nr:hypothetical protein [Polyangiaceae bacterium]
MKSPCELLHAPRRVLAVSFSAGALTSAGLALAQDPVSEAAPVRALPPPPMPSDRAQGTEFRPELVLDSGRVPARRVPAEGGAHFQIHGEYQLRLTGLSELGLKPMPSEPSSTGLDDRLRLVHWLRVTPRLDLSSHLTLVAQIDVPHGFIAGEPSEFVSSADPDYASREPFEVDPRWLYLEWSMPAGTLRAGQQPWHWGMGLVANDGDHPSLFGDYRGGARVERVSFATKPAGRASPVTLEAAVDLVFQDAHVKLIDGDRALQGVLAATYRDGSDNSVGFTGVYRHQERDGEASTRVLLLDSAGSLNAKIPGGAGHVFGEYEVAYLVGETGQSRIAAVDGQEREDYRAFGAATRAGFVLARGTGAERWGQFVTQVEWGWASGDANPDDGVQRRFRFDPNHNVGLILFDEVLAWKTARAANIARDPDLDFARGPGVKRLPSNGGVFGASYVNPTFVFRPVAELDLKLGLLVAQAASDFVDPVEALSGRTYRNRNYDGGNPHDHDLGLELDAGVEYRYRIPNFPMLLQVGAQGGVLFPGNALADVSGRRLETQYIGVGRLGLQY